MRDPHDLAGSAILVIAGLMGIAGVAMAAAAAHGADPRLLGGASAMCMAHAPALIALYAARSRFAAGVVAAALLSLGTLLFSLDLVSRHFAGHGLFPMAAPTGGVLMMAGWAAVAVGAFLRKRRV